MFGKNKKNKTVWLETTGRIVDTTPDYMRYEMGGNGKIQMALLPFSSGDGYNLYPVYEYQVNGVVYRKAGRVARDRNSMYKSVGMVKTVRYNASNPADSKLIW